MGIREATGRDHGQPAARPRLPEQSDQCSEDGLGALQTPH